MTSLFTNSVVISEGDLLCEPVHLFETTVTVKSWFFVVTMLDTINLLLLLQWKFWILHIRKPGQMICDFLIPILMALFLCAIKGGKKRELHGKQFYEPFCTSTLPLPFLCPIENKDTKPPANNGTGLRLFYSPKNSELAKMMAIFSVAGFDVEPKQNSKDLESAFKLNAKTAIGGIDFDDSYGEITDLKQIKHLKVSIRFPAELRKPDKDGMVNIYHWSTNVLYPQAITAGPRSWWSPKGAYPNYFEEGFLFFQQLLVLGFVYARDSSGELRLSSDPDNIAKIVVWKNDKGFPSIYMQRFPHSEWYEDPFNSMLKTILPIIMILVFLPFFINTVKMIVLEKERQLKEFMKIMGLSKALYWTSWFLLCFIYLFIIIIVFLLLLSVPIFGATAIFTYSDPLVMLLFFVAYGAATIAFAFIFCVLFCKATKAAIVCSVIWIIPMLFFRTVASSSTGGQLAASLLSNLAMCCALNIIFSYEVVGEGSRWTNLFKAASAEHNNTLGYMILMLFFDTFLYILIALYIEAVFPGEYGVPYPWNFPCKPSYWRSGANTGILQEYHAVKRPLEKRNFFETEPKGLRVGVKIRNLTKVYESHTVVNDVTLNICEDQITVLLGHNGAGKTTTMSMLAGMIPPTHGTAVLNGYDIRRDMRLIRHRLGICPQHNILYDSLTVEEHLYFYSRLKGLSRKRTRSEVDSHISMMQLDKKRNVRASKLSGGMKRKLCVCIALCGDSKIVMLDEPTSGMDPTARRALWDLMLKQKKGKTIILTTHFMDEADVLGDRIAIMVGGELKCCGSSFFLKKRFGSGYTLIIDKAPNCDVPKITSLLKSFVPGVQLTANTESEVTYLLPENRVSSFEAMLKELEQNSGRFGVRSYGISLTTMEEVFMKVGASHSHDARTQKKDLLTIDNIKPTHSSGINLYRNQIWAMSLKRWKAMHHSWVLWLVQFLLPAFFVLLNLAIMKTDDISQLPAMPLTLSYYGSPVTLVEKVDDLGGYYESYKAVIEGEKFTVQDANIVDEAFRMTKDTPNTFYRRYIIGATFTSTTGNNSKQSTIGVWFNNKPFHSPPLALGYALSAVFRKMSNCADCSIQFTNAPFPFSEEARVQRVDAKDSARHNFESTLTDAFNFTAAFYILFLIRENACKSRHLQYVAGTRVFIFWLMQFVFDFTSYLLICLLLVFVILCFQEDGYKTGEDIGRLFVIFTYFGWAVFPLIYVAAYFFKVPASGYVMIYTIFMITGNAAHLIIQLITNESVRKPLHTIMLVISPHYSFLSGLSEAYKHYIYKQMCEERRQACKEMGLDSEKCFKMIPDTIREICYKSDESYFKWEEPGIGRNILFSFLEGLILFILLFLIEYSIITRMSSFLVSKLWRRWPAIAKDLDDDVAEERERIRGTSAKNLKNSYDLVVKDLTKYYGRFRAVNGLCLGVKKYECFGLLGVNGAGKTTTFKMMTGDVRMTQGQGWVQGYSLRNEMRKVHTCIGYCPQFDALLDDMTGRETIIMFALIKGYRYSDAKTLAVNLSYCLDFREHLDKQVKKMSGGNKRKVSAAVAMIGDPDVLYFDEPTSGMDPATKYYFRDVVRQVRDKGRCIILTSHSLEECEALCTRLAIMVNGSFKCLGSVQHLKSKFAKGCTFTIKIERDANEAGVYTIEKYVKDNLPTAKLSERHQELLTYSISDSDVPWSRIFSVLEAAKRNIKAIEDYSIAQGSLEQVFLSFTKQQTRSVQTE